MEDIGEIETKPVIGESGDTSEAQIGVKPSSDSLDKPISSPQTEANADSIGVSAASEPLESREEAIAESEEPRLEDEENMEVEASEQKEALPQIAVQDDEKLEQDIVDENNAANESVANGVAIDELNGELSKLQETVEPAPEVKSPELRSDKVQSPVPPISTTPPRSQSKKPKVDLTSVPTRQYLDTTVVPILLQGLSALAKERPAKPISFLANFLLDKASEYDDE